MQWRQHDYGRIQQDAQPTTTEAAQHCCSADCPAEEEQEDEEAAAHKVAGTTAVHDHIVSHVCLQVHRWGSICLNMEAKHVA